MLWVGTWRGGVVRGKSVCVFACVTCKMWVRWVLVWGTNWNERRCASLSQHGRSICQGDITALTPHPSPPDATEPCSSWWLISIPPSLHCTAYPFPLWAPAHCRCSTHAHPQTNKYSCTLCYTQPSSSLIHTVAAHSVPWHSHSLSHTHMAGGQGPQPVTDINFLTVPNCSCSLVGLGCL